MIGEGQAAVQVGKAERIFVLSTRTLEGMPAAVPQLLVAISRSLSTGRQIVVAGTRGATETEALIGTARRGFHPDQVILLADGSEGQAWLSERVPALAGMKPIKGQAALYRCENFTCSAPLTLSEVEEMPSME
jgi:uncharacterized protein YyaL (SSP411 family)